jgi:WD40 repeat protein
MHSVQLESNPLDVYHLFAFAPKSTIFQSIYAKCNSFPHPIITVGLEDTWSSQVTLNTFYITRYVLSPCGNWAATGFSGTYYALYRFWNVELADGETYVHPCGTVRCAVSDVRFYKHKGSLRLQTLCYCCLLCRWDTTALSDDPIEKIHLEESRNYYIWTDDGSKAVAFSQQANGTYTHFLWKHGFPREHHDLHRQTAKNDQIWVFSPEEGNVLSCRSDKRLEIWDCIQVKLLFEKYFDGIIEQIAFSPDARFILVSNHHEGVTLTYISSESGATLWNCRDMATHLYGFLPDGDIVTVCMSSVQMISATDGSILVGPYSLPTPDRVMNLFINPSGEDIVLITSTNDVLGWRIPSKTDIEIRASKIASSNTFLIDISWPHSTIIGLISYGISFSAFDQFSLVHYQPDKRIHSLQLSPDGQYLAVITYSFMMEIWNCKSATLVTSTEVKETDYSYPPDIKLEFSPDSSFILIWSRDYLLCTEIVTGLTSPFELLDIITTTFISSLSSNEVMSIDSKATIYLHSCNGTLK